MKRQQKSTKRSSKTKQKPKRKQCKKKTETQPYICLFVCLCEKKMGEKKKNSRQMRRRNVVAPWRPPLCPFCHTDPHCPPPACKFKNLQCSVPLIHDSAAIRLTRSHSRSSVSRLKKPAGIAFFYYFYFLSFFVFVVG